MDDIMELTYLAKKKVYLRLTQESFLYVKKPKSVSFKQKK